MKVLHRKLHFDSHLKILYKLCLNLGYFSHVYDENLGKFKESKFRIYITTTVHCVLLLFSVFHIKFFFKMAYKRLSNDVSLQTVAAQEYLLRVTKGVSVYISVLVFSINCLRHGSLLLETMNLTIDIFDSIKTQTDSTIYYFSDFRITLVIKCFTFIYSILHSIFPEMSIIFQLPYEFQTWGYIFIQLVLICFYWKMSEAIAGHWCSTHQLSLTIKKLITISFRIRVLKRNLDKLFFLFFFCKYLKLFDDIHYLYTFVKDEDESRSWYRSKVLIIYLQAVIALPLAISASFDIYLIAKLSDMLIESERIFQQNVLLRTNGNRYLRKGSIRRKVDLLLLQTYIQDLGTLAWGKLRIDQRFSFVFVSNVIFLNVITCLQYYVSGKLQSSAFTSID